jgi:hypothetical protein
VPPFDIAAFRTAFPEFANTELYPTQMIEFWAGLAQLQVSTAIWKLAWTQGVSLYVAHEITLAAQNQKASAVGGVPGVQGGIANTKTVGTVTVGYDTTSTAEKDAGYWNLTNYGKQFIRLARIFGAGAVQL